MVHTDRESFKAVKTVRINTSTDQEHPDFDLSPNQVQVKIREGSLEGTRKTMEEIICERDEF